MIVISATLRVKEGKEDQFIEMMKELVQKVKDNEPGAIDYILHRSKADQQLFMVYERYKDGDAVSAHMTSEHFQAASGKMKDLLEGGLGIESYEVIA